MRRKCKACGKAIGAARLSAVPTATHCVKCQVGRDDLVKGWMVWDHKTAPWVELQNARTNAEFRRRGKHPRTAKGQAAGTGTVWEGTDTPGGTVAVPSARCHPGRPRVTPGGLCVECAVDWYKRRLGHE